MTRSLPLLAYLSTLGPIGKLPAPGTMGSLAAVIIGAWLAIHWGITLLVLATALVIIAGFPMASAHYQMTGKKDASEVIIDEVAGQWLALLAIPVAPELSASYLIWVAAAFGLFRLFDIWKPGPVGMAEKMRPNALGVMADDIIAGVFAGVVILMAYYGLNVVMI